jgi:aminoglycoside phosphotransferase (APT) family kinase protein
MDVSGCTSSASKEHVMPHALSLEAIATIFCATYPAGGTVLVATRVPQAHNCEVWRVDARHGRYALKVARAETDPARLANALAAQRLATAAGVPGPRILGYDEGALIGRAVYVQEWVAGADAATAWPRLCRQERERFAREFGRAVAQLHAISGPCFSDDVVLARVVPSWSDGLRQYVAKYAKWIHQAGLLPPAILEAVVPRLEDGIASLSPDLHPTLTHWDLWLGNALVDNGACVGLIDWESAAFSDPLADFVSLEVCVFDPYPESRAPFLAGYYERAQWTADTEARLHVYRGMEYLAEVYRMTQGGEVARAARFQTLLRRWLRTH